MNFLYLSQYSNDDQQFIVEGQRGHIISQDYIWEPADLIL